MATNILLICVSVASSLNARRSLPKLEHRSREEPSARHRTPVERRAYVALSVSTFGWLLQCWCSKMRRDPSGPFAVIAGSAYLASTMGPVLAASLIDVASGIKVPAKVLVAWILLTATLPFSPFVVTGDVFSKTERAAGLFIVSHAAFLGTWLLGFWYYIFNFLGLSRVLDIFFAVTALAAIYCGYLHIIFMAMAEDFLLPPGLATDESARP